MAISRRHKGSSSTSPAIVASTCDHQTLRFFKNGIIPTEGVVRYQAKIELRDTGSTYGRQTWCRCARKTMSGRLDALGRQVMNLIF
jgi:hypothetical protein